MDSASTIGAGTTIRGSIRGEGDLEIHGRVEGSVAVSGELVIGETALIRSDLSARRVTVRGAVAGNISATEAIVLEQGARVVGDLGAPQIGIRPGGLVRGNVATGGPLQASSTAAAATTRPRAAAPAARPAAVPVRAAPPARPAAAPPRAATPAPRPAPAARPAPAPAHARHEPSATVPSAVMPARIDVEETSLGEPDAAGGPPPPVVPAIRKGAKASLRRKGAR